jgi:mono/diheme cytochrome c family protein
MADQMLLGLFENVTQTADVIDGLRTIGVDDDQVTVMSNVPYAPRFWGRKPPRQMFLVFVLGGAVVGFLLGLFIAVVTPEIYPIEVGGQGASPVPPSAIIVFELTALLTMIAAFVGFLLQARFPILTRQMYDERITEGYIGVQVQAEETLADQVEEVFRAHDAHDIKRDDATNYPSQGVRHLLFWGGAGTVGLILLLIPLLLSYDIVQVPWFNTMKNSPAAGHQQGPRLAVPPESVPIQGPVLIEGQPATRPRDSVSEASLQRGAVLYEVNCSICHGAQGSGDGLVAQKYLKGTPALTQSTLPPEAIFTIITNGLGRMPSLAENLDPGETWDVVNYVVERLRAEETETTGP